MLYKRILRYLRGRVWSIKVHLIISKRTHMRFNCVYIKKSVCVRVEYFRFVYMCVCLTVISICVVLLAEISGLLLDDHQEEIDMEIPPHINGKDFPAIPQNSVLTHPR